MRSILFRTILVSCLGFSAFAGPIQLVTPRTPGLAASPELLQFGHQAGAIPGEESCGELHRVVGDGRLGHQGGREQEGGEPHGASKGTIPM